MSDRRRPAGSARPQALASGLLLGRDAVLAERHSELRGAHGGRWPADRGAPFSVALVGTFPPTECGLATYTSNVESALGAHGVRVGVIRLVDGAGAPANPPVVHTWDRTDADAPLIAARCCDRFDAVLVQHEFGIYPGADGIDVLAFVAACDRPVITALHTVLEHPSPRQRRIVDELRSRSRTTIVHSAVARARLLRGHLGPNRVAVVPHGATLNLGPAPDPAATPILLTWGLIGPGKGIEHAIEAVAHLRDAGVDVRYIVAGGAHPLVREREGERYREHLVHLAAQLGVDDRVEFDASYRDWDSLRALIRSCTLVLLPYESREQVTSGVLVEAIASGKPVVATAFPHAVELSRTGAVAVVAHRSPVDLAETIGRALTQPGTIDAMSAAARREASQYDWFAVGSRYAELLRATVRSSPVTGAIAGV